MTSGSGTRRRITPVTGLECDVRPNQTDSTIASGSTTEGWQNRSYWNFGCASQNNLAAQLDNPMDLVAPRAMTPIDAQNRSKVIQTYRGQDKKSNCTPTARTGTG